MSISSPPPPPRRSVSRHGFRAEPFLVLLAGLGSIILFHTPGSAGSVMFSEIAYQGTPSSAVCEGAESDWLELYNTDTGNNTDVSGFDLSGLILYDDQGVNDTDHVYTFPQGQQLAPGEYLVLCMDGSDPLTSPQFKIGESDTLTLFNPFTQEIVASVGPLPDGAPKEERGAFDVTYAWNNNMYISSSYTYTSTPTPGSANILTPVIMNEETTAEEIKERLKLQNALGTQFFGMDDHGLPVPNRLDDVLDLHLTMKQTDYDYLMQNASFQLYAPFTSARVTRSNSNSNSGGEELLVLGSPGRIRTKGQSTLSIAHCMGSPTVPFLIEFNNVNKTQTLYGVERIYLRSHFLDTSYMREWSAHRMLARFGLPHLRARKMRFFINGNRIGLYTVVVSAIFHCLNCFSSKHQSTTHTDCRILSSGGRRTRVCLPQKLPQLHTRELCSLQSQDTQHCLWNV
jgi:Lamin Tail Domain/CotH kinase protein